jgi:hypothetical protein
MTTNNKGVTYTHTEHKELINKRFKMLCLLAMQLEIWDDKMDDLAYAIDSNHPKALEGLEFYESKVIEVMEMEEEPVN